LTSTPGQLIPGVPLAPILPGNGPPGPVSPCYTGVVSGPFHERPEPRTNGPGHVATHRGVDRAGSTPTGRGRACWAPRDMAGSAPAGEAIRQGRVVPRADPHDARSGVACAAGDPLRQDRVVLFDTLIRPAMYRLCRDDAELVHNRTVTTLARLGRSPGLLRLLQRYCASSSPTSVLGLR